MSFTLIFKPLAEAEVAEAFAWYSQPDIGMGAEFLDELERIERFIRFNPLLYPRVEEDMRRASLRRFPYSLFYVIDDAPGASAVVLPPASQPEESRRASR